MPQFLEDPVTGCWVAIAEERTQRPNDFKPSKDSGAVRVCPFCPGNEHLTPLSILQYGSPWRLRVIPNKYPALTPQEGGVHEVIVDSAVHATSFGKLPEHAGVDMLMAAQERFVALRQQPSVQYIQLFKNNGPGSGASIEHPHSQLLGLPTVPPQVRIELDRSVEFWRTRGICRFCYLADPALSGNRIVIDHPDYMVFTPPAPRFPFEAWLVPRQHESHFETSPESSIRAVGDALHSMARALEYTLHDPPYNFLLHTAPLHEPPLPWYHWHIEILPRTGGIGGFEFATGTYINVISAEDSALILRRTV